MTSDLFALRLANFRPEGELCAFNLAAVAEALDTIAHLNEKNVGGETVQQRLGEYKSWDPDVFRVDKDCEDGFRRRLEAWGKPVVLLSEEAERVEIHTHKGTPFYCVADPFDGSYLFKRGIPDFWYSSLAFFSNSFQPLCCAVGDAVHRNIAFANDTGAFLAHLDGERLVHKVRLNAQYRKIMGRPDVTELANASIESYAMKPKKFLIPLVEKWKPLMEPFKFFLPNGGPYGFADVAEGKIDTYFAVRQPFVDIFSGIQVALQAEVIVTDFDGRPVKCEDNFHGLYDVVASTNRKLHDQVLSLISKCRTG